MHTKNEDIQRFVQSLIVGDDRSSEAFFHIVARSVLSAHLHSLFAVVADDCKTGFPALLTNEFDLPDELAEAAAVMETLDDDEQQAVASAILQAIQPRTPKGGKP